MSARATMTIRVAAEALAAYVDRELAVIEGIERGLADVALGNVVSHEAAMAEVRAVMAGRTRGE